MKAMVVDDSRAIRTILKGILTRLGCDVCEADNGRNALEVLQHQRAGEPVDLILADWNMPEMNGIDFIRSLRADPRNRSVKVMMVTTETHVECMLAALEAGADEYVMKPFTQAIIEDKLALLGVLQPAMS